MTDKNNDMIEIDDDTKNEVTGFISRDDVCVAQLERDTGICSDHLSQFDKLIWCERKSLKKLMRRVRRGKSVTRKRREKKSLITVEEDMREQLFAYINRDDVCVSILEKQTGLGNGALKRIANGDTLYTRQPVIDKIRGILENQKPVQRVKRDKINHEAVVEMFMSGQKVADIASKVKVSRSAIYLVLDSNNVRMSRSAVEVSAAIKKYCKTHSITVSDFAKANSIDTTFMYSSGKMHKHHADRIMDLLEKPPVGIKKNNDAECYQKRLDDVERLIGIGFTQRKIAELMKVHIITVARAVKKLKMRREKKK